MSRRYDESCLHIPDEVLGCEDYYDENQKIHYARVSSSNCHYVTSDGDVISWFREKPIKMKTYTNQHGHHYVDISMNGVKQKCLVHRLVAQAFIPNPKNLPIARHLDDDPDNNHYRNLAWGTAKDNHDDCVRNGHEFTIPVYCLETDTIYRSGAACAEALGISKASVTHCCKGVTNDVFGYHICYAEDRFEKIDDPDWLIRRPNPHFKPIIAISPEGEEIRFGSRKEAAEYIGIPECGISSTIHGTTKHTHGWRFREVDDE